MMSMDIITEKLATSKTYEEFLLKVTDAELLEMMFECEKQTLIENIKEAEMNPYSRATRLQIEGWKQHVRDIERRM